MKNMLFALIAAVAGFGLFSFSSTATLPTAGHDTIVWHGHKVTGTHTGTITVKNSDFKMENGALTGGSFMIDMTSINCTDLGAGQGKEKLEGHLKSGDFFGTEDHPSASFNITNVVNRGMAGDYKIVGDLTIKDITKEIKFNAKIADLDGVPTAQADISIDRSDFGVKYGSGSFFDNLGDKTIYDEFDISIALPVDHSH